VAGKAGGSSPHLNPDPKAGLKQELLREGHAFSFFQVIRLLRLFAMHASGTQKSPSDFREKLRIRPNLSMAFPASDVESIEQFGDPEDPNFLITANFLGLYGSASPLPTFYTEDLIDEAAEDESVSRDFIDIVNQRIFSLLFECWGKYRQTLQVVEEKNAAHLERLLCLLGIGEKSFRKDIPEPHRLLRYIGLFTQFPHSDPLCRANSQNTGKPNAAPGRIRLSPGCRQLPRGRDSRSHGQIPDPTGPPDESRV
jgi:type VI secretion system protein ImpH